MTRCEEFYDKVKKDGNFCGMSDKEYRRLVQYMEEVERDEEGKATISQGAWLKQKREQAKVKSEEVPNNDPEKVPNNDPEEVPNNTPTHPEQNLLDKELEQTLTDLFQRCVKEGLTGSVVTQSFIASMQKVYPDFYLLVEYAEPCSCAVGAKK